MTMTQVRRAPQPTSSDQFKIARRPTKQLPRQLIDEARIPNQQPWDASKHVHFTPPSKIYTMGELGLEGQGISETAISEPFSLFSEEAVRQMRAEIFSEPVLENCQYASSFATNMIRGACPQYAPFIHDAWNDPKVLGVISKIAGIELVPAWDHDIANINISIKDTGDETVEPGEKTLDGGPVTKPKADDMSAFGWHYDSVPFVCVTMLSDCTDMVGGETAIRTGDGMGMKMRGPAMGTAVVMQGRYIEHQALAARGGRERISMVCSLRPKNPMIKDESTLIGVRGISNVPELYYQYTCYRLRNMEDRMRVQLRVIQDRHASKRDFNLTASREFLEEQREYIDRMLEELVPIY